MVLYRVTDIKDQLSLKAAEKYMSLETSLMQSPAAHGNQNIWPPLQEISLRSFAAWTANQVPLSIDEFVRHESLIIRSLMSVEKTQESVQQIQTLANICERGKLAEREPEVLLLHSKLDDCQDNIDLTASFIFDAGVFLEDTNLTLHTAVSVYLFCKGLFNLQRNAAHEVNKILTSLLPFILSEGPLSLRAEVMILLWNVKSAISNQGVPDKALISVLERAIHLSLLLENGTRAQSLCRMGQQLMDDLSLPPSHFAFSSDLRRLCLSYGGEHLNISFQGSVWTGDVMDID